MSYNGSGTFQINTSGQPVVAGTVISSTAFNALTADLATGLSTAITKDGQTTATARIPFAAGISSTLVTDSSSVSTGSIITAGGVGIAKALYVGTNANIAGTLGVTGVATFSAAPIYSSLTASSAVATDASKALVSVTNTGTGNNVLATSPVLTTPALGTPQSGTVTNLTGTASININGTVGATTANTGAFTTLSATGVTTVQAGTALLPAITTTGDTNTGIFFPAADTIAFSEGGAEVARFDSLGNLGIGTASPAVKLDINGITGWTGGTTGQTAQIVGANSPFANGGNLRVLSNTTQAVDVGGSISLGGYLTSTSSSIDFAEISGRKSNSTAGNTDGYLVLGTRPNAGNMTERMRINSIGHTFINCTSTVGAAGAYSNILFDGVSYFGMAIKTSYGFAGSTFIAFANSAGTTQGSIYANATSSVQFLTSSDYRLKENIAPMTGALAKVSALKPVTYNWKSDGSASQGFIAHELQEVVPECIGGEKDAVDADGNPKYQGVDTSFLVATLTAAIQEQQALITALTARITALEQA